MNPAAALRFCIAIPVYNHGETLRDVVVRALAQTPCVLVVDDGSTDGGPETLSGLPAEVLRHPRNLGKGAAILTAAGHARAKGFSHMVTMDADGQHDPEDFHKFPPLAEASPLAIITGARDFNTPNVPASSRFGRRFSNFWLRVQTGQRLDDVQSGYRCYPLAVLKALHLGETRYSFEVEVLAKAAWAGFPLLETGVAVHYPPKDQRVSHFNAFMDNLRISLLNTRLTARAMMPLPQRQLRQDQSGAITVLHPLRSLRLLLVRQSTPFDLGIAGAFGVFVGSLPLPGLSCMLILLASGWLRLNKYAALATNQLCIPPFVPALCVEVGFYLRHGSWLTEFSMQTLGHQAGQRLVEWLLGSLVVAPLLAVATGAATALLARLVQLTLKKGSPDAARAEN